MGADPIIYCLHHVTDYAQFERLCSDVIAADGYPIIEPLGGFKGKGQDAIHVCREDANDVSLGNYNPAWAIAFEEGSVKHVYFIAETKGSIETAWSVMI